MFEHDPDTIDEWEAAFDRRTFQFDKDIKFLLNSGKKFNDIFVGGDEIPFIIKSLLAEDISLETVVMFDKLTGNIRTSKDFDNLLWPATKQKILKYGHFIKIDRKQLTKKVENMLRDAYK